MEKEKKKKDNNPQQESKKKKIIIFTLLIIFITLLIFWISWRKNLLKITLVGNDEIILEVNSSYQEGSAKATYLTDDISSKITMNHNVDVTKLGTYYETYQITYRGIQKEIKRTIIVQDTTAPELLLNGEEEMTIFVNEEWQDPGATATDNYDGNISNNIETKNNIDITQPGTYQINYTVKDSSGNTTAKTRTIICKERPIIDDQQIAVLNYHFFYDQNSETCNESICLDIEKFKEQLDYLKANNYKTLTMQEFRDWMYGKIDIPERSVLITIDDGAMGTGAHNGNKLIPILEEYEMHATLFLISGWWNVENYQSPYLDIESHTHDMHTKISYGSEIGSKLLYSKEEDVLQDLTLSIQTIGSKTAFCFPFYESSKTAIEQLKKVGFELAFVGGNRKVSRKTDKYQIPRYIIYKNTSLQSFINMVSN